MNAQELNAFLPRYLESRFPGEVEPCSADFTSGEIPELGGWLLKTQGVYCLVRISGTGNPFVWLKYGLAHGIPKSESLAYFVAGSGSELTVGRPILQWNDELAFAAYEETIFGHPLSYAYEPAMQDFMGRLSLSIEYAQILQNDIRSQFGGAPFQGDNWIMLAV